MTSREHFRALVALSPDIHSVYALRLACQLGRLGNLDLELVHVIETAALPRGAGWAPRTWAKEREEEMRQELEQLVQAVGDFCQTGPLVFEEGHPHDVLLRRLGEGRHDVVVLGASPLGRTGHIVGHLAKWSPVPVLVARGYRPLRRVLVCTDGTPAAERTLEFCGRMLGNSTLETTLLACADKGNGAAARRGQEILRHEGVEARVLEGPGRVWDDVLAEAHQGDYDLMVLAKAEASGGLREMLGGHPLLPVALHAACPVLIQPWRG